MVWLATKMWLLLLLAFVLGIASGWLVFWRKRDDLAMADGSGYSGEPDDLYREDERAVRRHNAVEPEDKSVVRDAVPMEIETPEPDRTVREYGNVPPKRPKVYEADLEDEGDLAPATLLDLPDRAPASPANLDSIDRFDMAPARRPVLFSAPMRGPADDLRAIRGIGETLERTLNAKGIFYYDQIAAWTDDHVTWIERDIEFPGRVRRENWIDQAIALAARNPRESEPAPTEPSLEIPADPPTQTSTETTVETPTLLSPSALARMLEEDEGADVTNRAGEAETDENLNTDPQKDDPRDVTPPIAPQHQSAPEPATQPVTQPAPAPGPTRAQEAAPEAAPEPINNSQPMTAMDRLIANKKLAKR